MLVASHSICDSVTSLSKYCKVQQQAELMWPAYLSCVLCSGGLQQKVIQLVTHPEKHKFDSVGPLLGQRKVVLFVCFTLKGV